MKDRLWIAGGIVAALALGACEARVTTSNSGEANGVIIRTDNAVEAIRDTTRDAGNIARRTGDALENGFDRTVDDLQNIGDAHETGREAPGNRH